jgi:hypothetical protein
VFNPTNACFCDTIAGALPNLDFLLIQLYWQLQQTRSGVLANLGAP